MRPPVNRPISARQPQLFPSRSPGPLPLRWLAPLLAALWFCACHTAPPLPPANLCGPDWTIRQGQAVWRSKRETPEIAGELLVASRHDGRVFLQFSKTPLPFVTLQITTNSWQVDFVADHKSCSGRGPVPAQLAWAQLPRCLAGTTPPARWTWEQFEDGRWRLEDRTTGEMIEGFLTR